MDPRKSHEDGDIPDGVQKVTKKKKKKIIAFTVVVIVLVVVGVVAGVVGSGAERRKRQQAAGGPPESATDTDWQELPAPGSDAAKKLLSDTNTPESIKELYTFFQDPKTITDESTRSFLQKLQQQQAATIQGRNLLQNPNSTTKTLDFQPFIRVARDVLNYLRYQNSEALLPMLRQYSASGGTQLSLTSFNPDLVQSEVDRLLQKVELDKYFKIVSNRGCDNRGNKTAGPAVEAAGRKLLHKRHHHSHHHHHHARRLHQAPAASTSRPQTLKEMLCEVSPWSPTGVKKMTLDGRPLVCSAQETSNLPGPAPFNIIVPVVFHCLRYRDADGYLQPMVEDDGKTPTDLGQNLIDKTNKYYEGTGIQFSLKEVRTDPKQYSYLMTDSLLDWQKCAANAFDEGTQCLSAKSEHPGVAPLIKELTMNVFVSGSREENVIYCKQGSDEYAYCKDTARGYSNPNGPWFGVHGIKPASWQESVPGQDWMHISWDDYTPAIYNSARQWDAGAATLAHEIGHYLAFMHTFETQNNNVPQCDGDGPKYGDQVPDTAASGSGYDLRGDLAGWCSDFRSGLQPDTLYLSSLDSCPGGGSVIGNYVDPIWNVMNYLPDVCVLTFTPNQVSRLQYMVTTYRPEMVAKYSV